MAFCVTLDILAMKMGMTTPMKMTIPIEMTKFVRTFHRRALKYGALSPFDDSDEAVSFVLYFYCKVEVFSVGMQLYHQKQV